MSTCFQGILLLSFNVILGKVGPPTLNSSVENTEIIVYIWHPVTPLKDGNEYKTIHQFYDDFSYEVFYNNQTTMVSECDELGCTAYLEDLLKDKTYCITAQGRSIYWDVKGEKSQEICVYIENKHFMTQNFIIGCIVSFCCVLLSLVIGMTLLLKGNPKTPQSVTLSSKRHFPLNTQQESRFDPISITTEETKSSLEKGCHVKPMLDTADTSQTDEPGYSSSLTGTEKHYSEDGHEPRRINDHDARSIEELNCSNNGSIYFHTDSDNGMPLDLETLKVTENTPLSEFKCPSSSSGYDKPHVPFIC
ncbi:hypothetical protein XENTR_v10013906 [Xenopus tropicalis]|nr:hypothetical protein XENTR_v10013906 [Xenopus tropicalis]